MLSLSSYSQRYWSDADNKCHSFHPKKCKAQVHRDAFDKSDLYITLAAIGGGKGGYGTCSITFKKLYKDSLFITYAARFDSNGALNYTGCTGTKNTYVQFLFKDGNTLKLPTSDGIDCGVTSIGVLLSEQDIDALLAQTIDKVRMNFDAGPIDFVAVEKQLPYFREQLTCIHLLN